MGLSASEIWACLSGSADDDTRQQFLQDLQAPGSLATSIVNARSTRAVGILGAERPRVLAGEWQEGLSLEIAGMSRQVVDLYHAGKYQEAMGLAEEAWSLASHCFAEEHLAFTYSASNVALLCWATARYEEAESMYRRVIDVRRRVLGNQNADVARSLSNLAEVLVAAGRRQEAEPLFQEALEIDRQVLGVSHADYAADPQQSGGAVQDDGQARRGRAAVSASAGRAAEHGGRGTSIVCSRAE